MLASYTAAPRQGHLNSLLHMYSYLDKHTRSRLVFDDSIVKIDDEIYMLTSLFIVGFMGRLL